MLSSERGELATRSWELKELKQLISKKNNHKMLLCMKCTVFCMLRLKLIIFWLLMSLLWINLFWQLPILEIQQVTDWSYPRCVCVTVFFVFFCFFFVGDGCIYLKVQIGQNGTKKVQSVCSKPFPHTLQFGFAQCIINVIFQSCC